MTTTTPHEPVIEVENLRCTYGGFAAAEDLSLHLRRGEYGLLGTNGAEKTAPPSEGGAVS